MLEDVLGWGVVFIVSIVLLFWDIPILDPILSILIISYVLFNVIKNLKETFLIFLQGVPSEIDLDAVELEIIQINKINAVHHTHIWSLDGEKNVLTIHLKIEQVASVKELIIIKRKVRAILREIPIEHATIEFEFKDESCYMI